MHAVHTKPPSPTPGDRTPGNLLLTAGPTHEPIDAVRFIGNRSSGRLGVAMADEAARRGWNVTLLLGPTHLTPADSRVSVHRFQTTAELDSLLNRLQDACEVLVMAAAVADYRPKTSPETLKGKLRRTGAAMSIDLEPTPDLLAGCAARRRSGQLIVGFALEPRDELLASARAKLEKKRIDLIVGNPLGTMESDSIEAVVLGRAGTAFEEGRRTPGAIAKRDFAPWLLAIIESALPSDRDARR